MRINVYTEELINGEGNGPMGEIVMADYISSRTGEKMTNYGLRIFLKSAPELHYIPGRDDDRSAVTFWCGDKQSKIFAFLDAVRAVAEMRTGDTWRKKTEERQREAEAAERERHRGIDGTLTPAYLGCVDFHGGKCHALTHMCATCPDRQNPANFNPDGTPRAMFNNQPGGDPNKWE